MFSPVTIRAKMDGEGGLGSGAISLENVFGREPSFHARAQGEAPGRGVGLGEGGEARVHENAGGEAEEDVVSGRAFFFSFSPFRSCVAHPFPFSFGLFHRWKAQAIMNRRALPKAREEDPPRYQYLVKFSGYDEPEWAGEVSEELVAAWERDQPTPTVDFYDSLALRPYGPCTPGSTEKKGEGGPGAAMAAITPPSVVEFTMQALLHEVHAILKRGLSLSLSNPWACKPRYTVRVACMPQVREGGREAREEK